MKQFVDAVLTMPVLLLGLGVLALCCIDTALASEVSKAELPYESALMVLKDSMTGPVAKLIAVIACAGGIITWIVMPDLGGITRLLLSLAIGAGALIGVVALVNSFSGQGALMLAEHTHSIVTAGRV